MLNKTDLPSSEPERVLEEINTVIGLVDTAHAINVSAKTGENCLAVLEQIVKCVPAAPGRPQGPPAGAGVRLPLRPVPRRGLPGADHERHPEGRRDGPLHGHRQRAPGGRGGRVQPQDDPDRRPERGRGGLRGRQHQDPGRRQGGRHHDPRPHPQHPALHRDAARLQGAAAGGVRRHLPHQQRRLREPAGRHGPAAAERQLVQVRARDQPGARLRLPLRLPRPAAHGDRPGAAGAGVRPGPHHHRPLGALQGSPHRRHRRGGGQPLQAAAPAPDRQHRGADHRGDHPHPRRTSSAACSSCARSAAASSSAWSTWARTG